MAKKYYDGDITINTDWGGDESTGNLPVVGSSVQKVIKDSINSKVGYVGRVERTGQGFYVLSRDEETFNTYLDTISDEKPFGDLEMDGINGRFDAPFNYKMNITLIDLESGYKSNLLGSVGNVIKFKAETLDSNNTPQSESMTITYKIKTEGGVETTYTVIYDSNAISQGIVYNLDGKLASGVNTVTITAVGMNTGISAMRRITYRLIDMSFTDKFDISKRYQFASDGTLAMTIGYDLKGVGKTKILWYFDGNHYATDELTNLNPNLSNTSRSFYFTESGNEWLTPGVHNIQMSMVCIDTDSGEPFQTPIYYREFIVEKTPTVLNTPYIVRKTSFDSNIDFLPSGVQPTIYNCKQFENAEIEYAAYYNGKSTCNVSSYIKYGEGDMQEVSVEELPLIADDFSGKQKLSVSLTSDGWAEIILRAYYNNGECFETIYKLEILPSDMKITTVTDNVVLDLNAFGRSNNASGKDIWEYKYLDSFGREQVISTKFSKNEYTLISTRDNHNNVIAPNDATEVNTLVVDALPAVENNEFKYLVYNDEYYVWNREFDWSDTSGWSDNKLKLANGNAITINYRPFSEDKLANMKAQGATFEFEFETTNVYNDDAVICRICGKENFAPGIVISASGAELVISREVVTGDGENAGYTKKVSTKYKSEESNRISFVITPDSDTKGYRNRILSIYVNGEMCGAYAYDHGTNFFNDSDITFRGSEDACVNISSIKMYKRALSSNEILSNYIYYRNDAKEKASIYQRNDIMLESNDETFDSDKLKSQLPVFMFYQIDPNQSLDDIHQEKKNKKLTRFFDVVYIDIQNPSRNFLVKNAYITPQGTSSMNYPVKNLRLYTGKKNDAGEYYSRLFVGSNIFIDGSPNNLSWDNINLDTEVKKKRQYAFKEGAIPVNCWCLKADFAESSSSHNTGTSRYWNQVLKNSGLSTKAQLKAAKYAEVYPYDVRTAIDGFPVVVFYQPLDGSSPRFEGKYNFNNDKSTESVFGFTGGIEIEGQEVKYYYIGKEAPIVHGEENDEGEWEWACEFASGGYTETPTVDSPLYASKFNADGTEDWYMLRGVELLDNPKMECWELLNSVNEIALFKTMKGFGTDEDKEKIGIVKENGDFEEAFESRYPDCGDYFHFNSLKRFGEWLVSCRYLDIDSETGASVPFSAASLPTENYHKNASGKLSICSLTKQTGTFDFNFPGQNFYREVDYNSIASSIKNEGYQQISIDNETLETIEFAEVDAIPETKVDGYEYIKCGDLYYTWMPSNVLVTDSVPSVHEASYDFVLVGETYYVWANTYKFEDYHTTQWVDDTAFNRALKFAVEKYDHIEMNKMAAYYIYLMRFGGVDQTVKNSMLTTEGPATEEANSTLPSLWYFINYDNDTILGVKNDGRLVFDPYITRETKDGTGYVYAGRESTLWNNLEADAQFMAKVTEIDNKLADGGADPLFSLSYSNALREYDINQSDKWCERIYNKDAERKYIDTYVKGWTQKVDKEGTETHVFEDYLYDVQGSRSAHRKWWLGRRFNVFDSRFCNANFQNQLIKFRSTNLPAGSSFSITSGEPVFYAWGHDSSVTAMTPTAIQPGDIYTFTTESTFNIGSYLNLMGAANISVLDLRNCVGALSEVDVTGCYSPSIGTKMKEILIGDHKRSDLVNNSKEMLKFSGLANASKLEVLDITNIKNAVSLDGLNTLLNIREVYASGTSIANFTFADGAMIEKLVLPSYVETLSLIKSALIDYDNILFEGNNFGNLSSLSIDNCAKLMNDPTFVLDWIASKPVNERANLSLNLQGINWTFNDTTINNFMDLIETVGTSSTLGKRNIRGNITLVDKINNDYAVRLRKIFGENCFKEGSAVYIKAPNALFLNMPQTLWEGDGDVKCDIITVGIDNNVHLTISGEIREELEDGTIEDMYIDYTDDIVTMDKSKINYGYVTLNIKESNRKFKILSVIVNYNVNNINYTSRIECEIKKRIYPESITINTIDDVFTNTQENPMWLTYEPQGMNDTSIDGRGYFNVTWSKIETKPSSADNDTIIGDANKETAYIYSPKGTDCFVTVQATVTRIFDGQIMCSATKQLEFKDPNTIVTQGTNPVLYDILVKNGIIEVIDGYGKLTKDDASKITMSQLIKNGKSIFADNTSLVDFTVFEWFNNPKVGAMPSDNSTEIIPTPDEMFAGCSNLEKIAFSDNFIYTGKNMFKGCTKLKAIYGASNGVIDGDNKPTYTQVAFEKIDDGFAKDCQQLEICRLSSNAEYIGTSAFENCISLTDFALPSNSKLKLSYNTKNTPFAKCKNIMFTTGPDYSKPGTMKYCIKDGACYELKDDGTAVLIHMGKDTLMSQIPNDRPIYACAYSMENRQENSLVIPSNIIFNGVNILTASHGNLLMFNNILGNSLSCDSLLEEAKFTTFTLNTNETKIPAKTFAKCETLETIKLPGLITVVGDNAFQNCTNLKTVIIDFSENVYIPANAFDGVMLESIQVLPNNYIGFKNTVNNLLNPFIKPQYLYETGEVRVIKDGHIILNDVDNVIKVGGYDITEIKGDYMTYQIPEFVSDLTVTLNGNIIGEITSPVSTIYTGNNLSLFEGDGLDFTYGVYNETVINEMNAAGWYYDARFKGIRSKEIGRSETTSMSFTLYNYNNKELPVIYGKYGYDGGTTGSSFTKVNFVDSSDNVLFTDGTNGFNKNAKFTTVDGQVTMSFVQNSWTRTGIDGCIINKIGESKYSDPVLNAVNAINNESSIDSINVILTSEQEIPHKIIVTVTDGIYHKYQQYWNGQPLQFIVPKGYTYTVKAESFIDANGKLFNEIISDNVVNGEITLNYETNIGITYNNGIISYSTPYNDYFIDTNRFLSQWSDDKTLIENVNVENILLSDADGYTNTQCVISTNITSSMFDTVKTHDKFGNDIQAYIPTYVDMEIIKHDLSAINEVLKANNANIIDFTNCWLSETYDAQHAWTSEGIYKDKNEECFYYIFGKRITC